jgi:hypothetical protein
MDPMRRYMFYLTNRGYEPKDATDLLIRARNLAKNYDVIMRDARVATEFIEFDVSIPQPNDIVSITSILRELGSILECVEIVDRNMDKNEAISFARSLFNSERYWRAHEVFESVWKHSESYEKQILNAIILVAAAFVHYQKNEGSICKSILKRAVLKIEEIQGMYNGIDINKMKSQITAIIDTNVIEEFKI